jgi:hypothetical protein
LARIGNPNITFATDEEPADYDEEEKSAHAQRLAAMLEQEISSTPTSAEELSSVRPQRGSGNFPLDVEVVQKYVNSIIGGPESAQLRLKTEVGSTLPEDNAEATEDFLAEAEEQDFLAASRENRGITAPPAVEPLEVSTAASTVSSSPANVPEPIKTTEIGQSSSSSAGEESATKPPAAEERATTVLSAAEDSTEQPKAAHRMEAILIEPAEATPTESESITRLPALILDEELHKELKNPTSAAEEAKLSPLEQHVAIENGPIVPTADPSSRQEIATEVAAQQSATEVKEAEVNTTEAAQAKEDDILVEASHDASAAEAAREARQEETTLPAVHEGWEGSFLEAINDHVAVATTSIPSIQEDTAVVVTSISQEAEEKRLEDEIAAEGSSVVEQREEREDSYMQEEDKMRTEAQLYLLSQEIMGGGGEGAAAERFERDYRRDESAATLATHAQLQRAGRQHQGDGSDDGIAQHEGQEDEFKDMLIAF